MATAKQVKKVKQTKQVKEAAPAKPDRGRKVIKQTIRDSYNVSAPHFAFICGGMRRIAVDPSDRRAQMQLLRHGIRYFSKIQALTYSLISVFKPDIFVDVGVNYGESLFCLPLNSQTKVIGFEANPELADMLERSLVYNDDLSVEIVGKAVSDESDGSTIPFYLNRKWSGKSTALPFAAAESGTERIEVETTTVDAEVLSRYPTPETVVMKVDVEGLEPKVLRGTSELFAAATNVICILEFDSKFLESGEETARGFFEEMQSQFHMYLARRARIEAIESFEGLAKIANAQGRLHCDLIVVKAGTPEFLSRFEKRFCNRTLGGLVKNSWNLPAAAASSAQEAE
jgi:FkbM family methyltransferase